MNVYQKNQEHCDIMQIKIYVCVGTINLKTRI